MTQPILYGAAYSVYVRAARMALAEKGVGYRLIEVDVFAPNGPPTEHLSRQPFGKIPAFEHAGFRVYETGAITRYIDEAFDGPALQPSDPRSRARMTQAISILDGHVYPDLVWGLYVERVEAPRLGRAPDEARIARLLPKAETTLAALSALSDGPWLAAPGPTLADFHAAPMFDLFVCTPEGQAMLLRHPRMADWWRAVSARPSFSATATV
ncbi:MAG: glutathione S-transferase family protein [Phenylobacterium sp.]|uniref:glutathione S-transferase family protein n=1 Tax=Phenylobacterium sp. TaxID=1871053 RepID=UPI0027247542|nr:glutathione S-transferase family protein [Phenylobacterium sp.]MDO9429953.1 glutathione S-transferase family protein [Phenylobacterium sp.]